MTVFQQNSSAALLRSNLLLFLLTILFQQEGADTSSPITQWKPLADDSSLARPANPNAPHHYSYTSLRPLRQPSAPCPPAPTDRGCLVEEIPYVKNIYDHIRSSEPNGPAGQDPRPASRPTRPLAIPRIV
jgi:hypothetical protein